MKRLLLSQIGLLAILSLESIRCAYHQSTMLWVVREGKQVEVPVEFVEQGETIVVYDIQANEFSYELLLIKQGTVSLATEYKTKISY